MDGMSELTVLSASIEGSWEAETATSSSTSFPAIVAFSPACKARPFHGILPILSS